MVGTDFFQFFLALLGTFLAYLGIQWWAFRRSDGGGEFVQRLLACRSEADAERAAWLFV